MKLDIQSNIKEVTKHMNVIQKKQIPFAASVAMNKVIFGLQKAEKKQVDKVFDEPTNFTKTGFVVVKSTKKNLVAELYINNEGNKDRARYMRYEVDGGTRHPYKTSIAIPRMDNYTGKTTQAGNFRKGAITKMKAQRAKFFFGKPKGARFSGASNGIWERYARDTDTPRIRQIALFTKYAKYKPLFPFYETANTVVMGRGGFKKHFEKAMRHALRTAR
jgi:hypothetical protein